jgi:hypothetical protein
VSSVDLLRHVETVRWAPAYGGSEYADEPDPPFGSAALALFREQCARIPEYGRYAIHLGRDPDTMADWRDIPPVPVSAFRTRDLSAVPPGREAVAFETSGTTGRPGRVRLGSTRLYEASIVRNFTRHLLPDGTRLHALVFGPKLEEAPRSSLWFMVDHIARTLCDGAVWLVEDGQPRWDRADDELERAAARRRPLLLLGTSLFFQAYFERSKRARIRFVLPPGSRAMDTGGSKGARVEIRRDQILDSFRSVLGLTPDRVVNEYGMAEMSSQFYEDKLLSQQAGRPGHAGFVIPPWVRTRALDPETMHECPRDVPGVLVHYDLANRDVPFALQTEDVGAVDGRHLLLQGRLPEAERRGCSLPFERFLERETT